MGTRCGSSQLGSLRNNFQNRVRSAHPYPPRADSSERTSALRPHIPVAEALATERTSRTPQGLSDAGPRLKRLRDTGVGRRSNTCGICVGGCARHIRNRMGPQTSDSLSWKRRRRTPLARARLTALSFAAARAFFATSLWRFSFWSSDAWLTSPTVLSKSCSSVAASDDVFWRLRSNK